MIAKTVTNSFLPQITEEANKSAEKRTSQAEEQVKAKDA